MIFSIILLFAFDVTERKPECSKSECSKIVQTASKCVSHIEPVFYDPKLNLFCIRGTFSSNHALRDGVLSIKPHPRPLVVITSDGGLISDAMDMTEYLEKFKFDVAVNGICASACAQFVFVAGQKKYITGDGAVAMHGGPISDAVIDKMDISEENKLNIKNENKRFIDFYKKRNINLSLVLDAPKRVLDQIASGKIVFWIPTEQQFYKANVQNVSYCDSKFRNPDQVTKK